MNKQLKKILAIVTLTLITISCNHNVLSSIGEKQIDKRIVGEWKGSTLAEVNDMPIISIWNHKVHKDGTYVLDNTVIRKAINDTVHGVARGKWWVKDGIYYELENTDKGDFLTSYSYKILNKNEIYYKMIKDDTHTYDYEFTDYRVK